MLQGILNILTIFNTAIIIGYVFVAWSEERPKSVALENTKMWYEEHNPIRRRNAKKSVAKGKGRAKSSDATQTEGTAKTYVFKVGKKAPKPGTKERPAANTGRR